MSTLEIVTGWAKKTWLLRLYFIQTIIPGMSLNFYYLIYYLTSIPSHPVLVMQTTSFLPITPSPSYTPIQHWSQSGPHQSNRYSPSAYPESQLESNVDSLMPDSDYCQCLDRWDGHKFQVAEDLSPLAIDYCQLLPAFKDVFGNDLNPASPTETRAVKYSQFSKVFLW